MSSKSLIWMGLIIGSTIGGFLPTLWGASFFSLSSFILSVIGGFMGIWIGFKIGKSI